jgi:hypothetical protein
MTSELVPQLIRWLIGTPTGAGLTVSTALVAGLITILDVGPRKDSP